MENIKGKIDKVFNYNDQEDFLQLDTGNKVSLDFIITVNGKPAPAYDEYDSFANASLDYMGGMED